MRKFIKVNLSGSCNLSCSYCFGFTSKELAPNAINNLEKIFGNLDPKACCFRVECTGEITLYPDILDYINKKCKNEGYVVEILSNGTNAPAFLQKYEHLSWVLSLDGHTEEMNSFRNLGKKQVDKILDAAISTGAELQCVFLRQTTEQMNRFIDYLGEKSYKGFLNIFPCRFNNRPVTLYLDYKKLLKADFIPGEEYFRRWKIMFETGKRDFICDVFNNGYTYRINSGGIKKIKCECYGSTYEEEIFDEPDHCSNISECGSCFTHYEYNNSRRLVQR